MMKTSITLLLALLSLTSAQNNNNAPDPNSDFYKAPSENIDFPGCFSDLKKADVNGDGVIKKNEYLGFIQRYATKRLCVENPFLTLQQRIAFNTIACGCRQEEGSSSNCCIGDNAQIRTDGALNPQRTGAQQGYLTSACRITDETLPDPQCPPVDDTRDRGVPPPLVPFPMAGAGGGGGSGLPKEALWALIAAAALLLCLCCCCVGVLRRRRQKQLEEEEAENMADKGAPGEIMEEQAPGGPGGVPGTVAVGGAPLGTDEEDDVSEYDEEGRKNRGGGPLGDESEEDGRKRYGAGRLPPPEKEDPNWKLRPIDPENPDPDPEWDQPGRQIDYPKDKDEMSAGKVDHYEPDGGVYIPEREGKDPVIINRHWERQTPEEPDEVDTRKHRIQSGLGQGEVWNQLAVGDDADSKKGAPKGDVFDWVVESALGVLDKNDEANGADQA